MPLAPMRTVVKPEFPGTIIHLPPTTQEQWRGRRLIFKSIQRLPILEGNIIGVVFVILTSTGAFGSLPARGLFRNPVCGVEVVSQCEGNTRD